MLEHVAARAIVALAGGIEEGRRFDVLSLSRPNLVRGLKRSGARYTVGEGHDIRAFDVCARIHGDVSGDVLAPNPSRSGQRPPASASRRHCFEP